MGAASADDEATAGKQTEDAGEKAYPVCRADSRRHQMITELSVSCRNIRRPVVPKTETRLQQLLTLGKAKIGHFNPASPNISRNCLCVRMSIDCATSLPSRSYTKLFGIPST